MRKFNFDNLALFGDDIGLFNGLWIGAFSAKPLNLPVFARQPGPLFATFNGTPDDDTLVGTSGNDVLRGYEGDDILIGGAGEDQLNGGVDFDMASYASATAGVTVRLRSNLEQNTGDAAGDTYFGIEGIIGSDFDDIIYGGWNAVISGGQGDDMLYGGGGINTPVIFMYQSADPNDYQFIDHGGSLYSVVSTGGTNEGTDMIAPFNDIDKVLLGGINGTLYSFQQLFTANGAIYGSSSDDTLTGTSGDDLLVGLGGADIFFGLAGNDIFDADFSDLEFYGGDGYDRINFEFDVSLGSDIDLLIDVRDYALESIEEISLDPTVTGGGSGSLTYYFEIGTSQFDQLHRFNAAAQSDMTVLFDGANTLDLTDFSFSGSSQLFYVEADFSAVTDFTLTFDHDHFDFISGGGDDTIIGQQDPTQFWFFIADGDHQTTSIDTIDFSQMLTVDDGNGGTLGRVTFDLPNNEIIQTGFGLATDSSAQVTDFDIFIGWDGDDVFIGDSGDNIFVGNGGNNVAVYNSANVNDYTVTEIAAGVFTVESSGGTGEGVDTLTDIQTIRLDGINGTDYDITALVNSGGPINLTNGDDDYTGTAADEIINGLDGDDIIRGEGGDDIINGGEGSDTIDGGTGNDTASYIDATSGATVDWLLNAYSGSAAGDTLTNIENVIGSDFEDLIRGDNANNRLEGGAGDDFLRGRNGDDVLFGGDGNDDLFGDGNNDILVGGRGSDNIVGGADTDVAVYNSSNTGDYFVRETDRLEYQVIALNGQDEGEDSLSNVETIRLGGINGTDYAIADLAALWSTYLTSGDDDYTGTSTRDTVFADDGNDVLRGLAGEDFLFGEAGDDTLIGGEGADRLDGGEGNDTASYVGSSERVVLDLFFNTASNGAQGDVFISIENVIGTDFNDVLRGGGDDNILMGGAGDDSFSARAGDDTLLGELGDDTLRGEAGNDILFGGEGADILIGGNGDFDIAVYSSSEVADYVLAATAPGEYTIEAIGGTGEGTDTLAGIEFIRLGGINGTDYDISIFPREQVDISLTNGDDVYSGTIADEIINAMDGNDIIDGGAGNNTLNGGGGNDILISLGNDVLNGGTGNDTVEMGGNVFDTATATDGGADVDTLSFSTLAQFPSGNIFLVIDLQSQSYSVRDGSTILHVDQFTRFENATGSEYRDLLQGDASNNVLSALGGDDNLQGRDGDDVIDGGAGADILNGGAGIDVASYVSALAGVTAIMGNAVLNTGDAAGDSYIDIEDITGSEFDDVLGGDANANIIDGGAGFDIASYVASSGAIVFDGLGLVTASGDIIADTLVNIEAIGGTNFDDRLFGDNGASIFYGGEGNDRLFGRNGDDELYGEGGDDIILGGRDNDLIDGGAGNDQLRGNEGDDTLLGGDGNDVLAGGAGADVLDGGAGIDRVEYTYGTNAGVTASLGNSAINTGDAAGDTYVDIENLYGTTFNDTLFGDAGNNRIDGRLGDDVLFGGDGNDYLIGGAGDDVMNGEAGNDLFLGQAGADIYQFDGSHGTDRIVVFAQGEDLIKFTEGVFDFSGLTITQDGAHVNIVSSEGTIIVNNSLVADFATDDFIFANPPSNEPLDDTFAQNEADLIEMDFDALI